MATRPSIPAIPDPTHTPGVSPNTDPVGKGVLDTLSEVAGIAGDWATSGAAGAGAGAVAGSLLGITAAPASAIGFAYGCPAGIISGELGYNIFQDPQS